MDVHKNIHMDKEIIFKHKSCYSAESSGREQTSQKKGWPLKCWFWLIYSDFSS